MAYGFGNPGANLTRKNRFAQMLIGQPSNTDTTAGGLAHILRQTMGGVLQGQDTREQAAAMDALTRGMAGPELVAGPGTHPSAEYQGNVPQGGMEGAIASQRGLEGNEYARRNLAQLLQTQMGQDYATSQAALTRSQGMEDYEKKLQLKQKYPVAASVRPSAPVKNFARRQELVKEFGDGSAQVRRFDDYVRSTKVMNLGGTMGVFDPSAPSAPTAQIPVSLKPGEEPDVRRRQAAASAEGAAVGGEQGDVEARLSAAEASMPRLEEAIVQLKALGEVATYTTTGRGADIARKEAGMEPTEGAIARSTYIAHVKNNVLPLLRQTFGAAFTAAEGDSLLATLGDPNMHPREKDAVLDAFISDKAAELNALRRQAGKPESGGPLTPDEQTELEELRKRFGR